MPILKSLDEIFGKTASSRYLVKDEESYREYLAGLSKFELQNECIKQKVNPRDVRDLMTNELVKEFKRHNFSIAAAKVKPTVLKTDKEIEKIFRNH